MKRKKQNGYPPYYRRNAARQAERRYLSDGMTQAKRNEKRREEAEEELLRCFRAALQKQPDVWSEDINQISRCAEQVSRWYEGMKEVLGAERAKALLKERAGEIMPERFLLPVGRSATKAKELSELSAVREAAEVAAWIYAIAIHDVMGYGQKRAEEIFETAKEAYRQRGSGD